MRNQLLLSARSKSLLALLLSALTTVWPEQLAAQMPDSRLPEPTPAIHNGEFPTFGQSQFPAPWLAGSTSATQYREFLPSSQSDPNPTGLGGTLSADILTFAPANPFFQALGTNGRTCATCHQPENAMSISVSTVQQRYMESHGADPLFAPIDGADCPDAVKSSKFYAVEHPDNPHSLLLKHALIRVGLAWPPAGITPEFSITEVRDPTHCELSPTYGIYSEHPTVSVYRRSLMAANLKYVTTVGVAATPPGVTLPIDPYTGEPESGNIMFDGREPTLQHQAMDALITHAQASSLPSAAVIQQIVDFENGIYSAQVVDDRAHSLTEFGATGGPSPLRSGIAGLPAAPNTFSSYSAWSDASSLLPHAHHRASVARGEAIFNGRPMVISDVAGINDLVGANLPGTCASCHSNTNNGSDVHPQAQLDEGTSGLQFGLPAPDLPLFQLTCIAGKSTPFNGSVVYTRDPGKALITGKCADIGKIKSAQLRGLAGRAPYFHDGSAATLQDVVNFYNKRFNLNFTVQEKQDLVNFLDTL